MEFRLRYYVLIFIGVLQIGQTNLLAQTGPAGVGNSSSNKIWLDASSLTGLTNGARISSWTDRSGNNWNAVQGTAAKRPTYLINQLNGRPVIRFDRTNSAQYLDITSAGIGTVMSNSNMLFVVAKANSGAVDNQGDQWQSIFGTVDWFAGILFQGFPTTGHLYVDNWVGNPPAQDLVIYPPINQGQWYIATRMPTKLATGTTLVSFVNGANAGSISSNLQMKNYNNLVRMGACTTSGVHQYLLNGDIAEAILFNINLNNAQRIIVDNYLSAKYNITTATDYYSGNEASYIIDVQGIGTTDGSINKHISAGNGKGLLLLELNNTLNAANEFLFAGHASTTNVLISTDLPPGEQSRWQRSWYLEKTGSMDAKLSFDFSQAGLIPESGLINNLSSYKLLYRSTPSGNFTIVKNGNNLLVPGLESGDQLTFALSNDQLISGYYTISYAPSLTWTGALNEQWDQAGNWNLNRVPTASDHVFINACSTCPILNSSPSISGLQLNTGAKLNLGTFTLSVAGRAFLNESTILSNQGTVKASDFDEVKNSMFKGAIILEKTGGNTNTCYGGNTFSPELKFINASNSNWEIASQASNVILNSN